MRYFVQPYKQGSKSAKALALALGGKVLRKQGSKYKWRKDDVVINWGDSAMNIPRVPGLGVYVWNVMNHPEEVAVVSNKAKAFELFQSEGVPIPKFALSTDAVSWQGTTVVRHKLQGHSGEGIELVEPGEPLPAAPLYVEYVKKEDEYRVHVGNLGNTPATGTSIIAVQRKARRLDAAEVNWQVRNHDNGFVYVRGDVNPPQAVLDAASQALVASGLCFGAVDVIYNVKQEKAYVLEINTAPGLEGQTVQDYASFFSSQSPEGGV